MWTLHLAAIERVRTAECSTALTAFVAATSAIGVGTLVTNPVLRPPGLVVRQALAVDHLSSG